MNHPTTPDYQVGDTVTIDLAGTRRDVVITAKHTNVKNDSPGFDADFVNPDPDYPWGVWGYDDQVVRIVRKGTVR